METKLDKEYIKKYEGLLSDVLEISSSTKIPESNDDTFYLLHIFLTRQISLLKAIYKLAKEDFYYEGCILLTTLIENYILQKWLIREDKIKDYVDFGAAESLPRLALHPEETEGVWQFIKEHNVKRFLKKKIEETKENLLNKNNYTAKWKNLKNITNDLIGENGKGSEVKEMKKIYDFACGFKHSCSYAVLSRMGYDVVPQDAFLLYNGAIYVVICNLSLIDRCCHIEGLEKKLKDFYLQLYYLAKDNPILKNELKNIRKG